jgi:hypothetical protein
MNDPRPDSLDAALARLPLEIAPRRDLWPGIAQATRSAPHRRWRAALAASLALFALVGALGWSAWRHSVEPTIARQYTSVSADAPQRAGHELADDEHYRAARIGLERTFEERLQLLAPATRARVRQDLETIRKANADIREALRADPASPVLLQLMRSTWQQEFDLYTTVTHTTDTLLTRRS